MVLLLVLLVVLIFAGAGFAVHLLWFAAIVFGLFWIIGAALGRGVVRPSQVLSVVDERGTVGGASAVSDEHGPELSRDKAIQVPPCRTRLSGAWTGVLTLVRGGSALLLGSDA